LIQVHYIHIRKYHNETPLFSQYTLVKTRLRVILFIFGQQILRYFTPISYLIDQRPPPPCQPELHVLPGPFRWLLGKDLDKSYIDDIDIDTDISKSH
jgi:hypothetical protein